MKSNTLKVILSVLFITCGLILLLTVKKPPAETKLETEIKAVPVTIDIVKTMDIAKELNTRGTLEPTELSEVGFSLPGTIEKLHVDEGAQVKAGEVLAKLDSSQYVLNRKDAEKAALQANGQVIQANANMKKAESEHADAAREAERSNRLFESKTIAKQELDKMVLALDVAEADFVQAREQLQLAQIQKKRAAIGVETAELQLRDTRITAPIDGVVTRRMKYVGEVINPGTPVFKIENLDVLEFKADVSSSYLGQLRTGLKVILDIEGLNEPVMGKIDEISETVHPVARTLEITVRINNSERKYKPGMFARAKVVLEEHLAAMVIPRESIVGDDSGSSIFLVENGIAKKTSVKTVLKSKGWVEVTGDMKPGAHVVVFGKENLQNGVKVLVR